MECTPELRRNKGKGEIVVYRCVCQRVHISVEVRHLANMPTIQMSALLPPRQLQRGGGRSGRATIPSGDGSQVAGAVPSGVVC